MKQAEFEAKHRIEWEAFANWVDKKKKKSGETVTFADGAFPEKYRALCQQLSIAKDRYYSTSLIEELHRLVEQGHQALYGGVNETQQSILTFFKSEIPQTFRREWKVNAVSAGLFFIPLIFLLVLLQFRPDFVIYIISHDTISSMEQMYKPGNEVSGFDREASSDMVMWGIYIWNNIRIDFQCFATGLFFGLGSIFFTAYNGFIIGAVAGHLTQIGYTTTFWSFVAGHSGPELTGIVLAGAGGLKLGYSLISPKRLSRKNALKNAARPAVVLVIGAATLTFLAAFIEAFWSAQVWVSPWVKYSVGVLLWTLVWLWLCLGGRKRRGH